MTDNIEAIKKERRDLFRILGDTFSEHASLDGDHEIGSSSSCELCLRHNLINNT